MAEDVKTEGQEQTGAEGQGDAGQQEPKYLTEDALDAKLKGFSDSLFSMVRKMSEQQAPKEKRSEPKAKESSPTVSDEVSRRLAALESDKQFFDAVADLGLSKDERAKARRLFDAEKPTDLTEWTKGMLEFFGKSKGQTQTSEAEGSQVKRPQANAAATTAGAPGDLVTQWSREDYERQFALKAKVPGNVYDVRNRAFHREIRERAESEMRNVRVDLRGPRK